MSRYVLQISKTSTCRVRQIAWAVNQPMTKTLDAVIEYIARHIDQQAVCTACRDNSRCGICGLAELRKTAGKAAKSRKINLSELS